MRASKTVKSQKEIHISGAEGLYEASDIQRTVKKYIERALCHPKGKADKIILTIEDIKQSPEEISALPISTIDCRSPSEGLEIASTLLQSLGISEKAVGTAFELIKKGAMRGAAIITAKKGRRLEPDKERGVRVSRLGIKKTALRSLSSKLSRSGINTDTIKEAIILASKVAAYPAVSAELCVSDDPDYLTGYVASKELGYLRIPNIKHKKSKSGGRAFFVEEGTDVQALINYLERVPAIIGKITLSKG